MKYVIIFLYLWGTKRVVDVIIKHSTPYGDSLRLMNHKVFLFYKL